MSYATVDDIRDLHGEKRLKRLADRDANGALDTSAVEKNLDAASAEIDSYLSRRYALPIPDNIDVPDSLVICCIEIAAYRMANDGPSLTDDIRKRYEDMRKWLEDLADGKVNLGIPEIDDDAEEGQGEFRASVPLWGVTTRV